MTKDQAKNSGFCDYCAAFWGGRQHCGVLAADKSACQLDDETRRRWMADYGLKIIK